MISVDTSVVVRYLVGTPQEQAERAARLIEDEHEIGVSLVVLAETAHVLRTVYQVPGARIVELLIDFVTKENVASLEIPKMDTLDALVRARAFPSSPITDALIAASARARGALPVYTFDRRFARLGATVASP